MESATTQLRSYAGDDRAATSIEYAFLASLIALVMLSGVIAVGTGLASVFNEVANRI